MDREVAAESERWIGAGVWLPVWGVLIGIVYAAAFRVVWFWLGEYQHIRVAPMALLLVLDVGWFGYRLIEGAGGVLASWRARRIAPSSLSPVPLFIFIVLAVLLKFALLVSLPAGAMLWPADWRENLRVLYPYVMYRPLILMPLWGRWAVLLAGNIGRVAPAGSERLRRMAGGYRLPTVMVYWAAVTGLTVLYCSPAGRHVAWSMLLSLGMLLVAYLVSFALSRRFGGQTEATVLAAGWAAEMAFLLVYLPIARAIYWY